MNGTNGSGRVPGSPDGVGGYKKPDENQEGTLNGKKVTQRDPSINIGYSDAAIQASAPPQTPLAKRAVSIKGDQALDTQHCLFQKEVVQHLIGDDDSDSDYAVYYVDPNGEEILVDDPSSLDNTGIQIVNPRNSEQSGSIQEIYQALRQELRENGGTLLGLCDQQLDEAKRAAQVISESEEYESGQKQPDGIALSKLFLMLDKNTTEYAPDDNDGSGDFVVVGEPESRHRYAESEAQEDPIYEPPLSPKPVQQETDRYAEGEVQEDLIYEPLLSPKPVQQETDQEGEGGPERGGEDGDGNINDRKQSKIPDSHDPNIVKPDTTKEQESSYIPTPLLSGKEGEASEQLDALYEEELNSDLPILDDNNWIKIKKDLAQMSGDHPESTALIEAIDIALTDVEQAEGELLRRWRSNVPPQSIENEIVLTGNPPDGNALELKKINDRKECIEKLKKCLVSLKKQDSDSPLSDLYNNVVNTISNKITFHEKGNEKSIEDYKYIKDQLQTLCQKDIGVAGVGSNDVEEQLKALGTDYNKGSYLYKVMQDVQKPGINEKVRDVIQRSLNQGYIKGIIDTQDSNDSIARSRNGVLGGVRASRLIQATAKKLLEQADIKMRAFSTPLTLEDVNAIRKIKKTYSDAIAQLKTSNWGSNDAGLRERQIYPETRKHINGVVNTALGELDQMTASYQLVSTGGLVSDVKEILDKQLKNSNAVKAHINKLPKENNESEVKAVTELMRNDPYFCRGVVAAFGSLDESFMGKGGIGANYQERSHDAMRMLRINHNLGRALYAPAVLQAVIHDVCLPGSWLMPHFISRYGGSDTTSDAKTFRNQKIIEQAAQYLQQESTKKPPVLGNKLTRESFARKADLYSEGTVASQNKNKLGSGNELINSFLKGVGGTGVISTPPSNEKHIDTGIQINGEPLLMSGKPLSIDLLGARWSVDPGFFIDDYPDVVIPFEGEKEDERDWLPLKDSLSGKTAILAMSKKAGAARPFLYTMDTDKQWRCMPMSASGDPDKVNQEEFEGVLFALGACFVKGDISENESLGARAKVVYAKMHGGMEGYSEALGKEFHTIKNGSNKWLSRELTVQTLVTHAEGIKEDTRAYDISNIMGVTSAYDDMKITSIEAPVAFDINRLKMEKDGQRAQGNVVVEIPPDSRAANFEAFKKPPTYDVMTHHMVETLKSEYKGHKSMLTRINQIEEEIREYGNLATNPSLHAFKGCVISTDNQGIPDALDKPKSALNEVIGKSWRHSALLFQEREQKQREIQKILDKYYDNNTINTKLFEHAVLLFEQHKIPEGMDKDDQSGYLRNMASYLLLENASQIEHQQLQGKTRLLDKLEKLESQRPHMNKSQFEWAGKQWNLEMALVAEQQLAIDSQLNEYSSKALDSKTLAKLAFECRAKTVLRNNQVDEVNEAMEDITNALSDDNNGRMSRVSQKGTGWGKSTVLKMLSDHASSQLRDITSTIGAQRSVMIIAPKSNQAELDITFGQYFRKSGRDYRRLNMSDYTNEPRWWCKDGVLDEIHNTLLGLPTKTDPAQREAELNKTNRAPVGASIEDVQVLVQLKRVLEKNKNKNENDSAALDKLNTISDLFRESMLFCDEWDSALMPPKLDMLNDITKTVSSALGTAGSVSNEDVRNEQATFIMGAKRKHLLSATAGSTYLLLQATGKTDVRDAQKASNLGIEESNYRALRWINEADILFHKDVNDKQDGSFEKAIAQKVVSRIGNEQGILYLDGRQQSSGQSRKLAQHMGAALQAARKGGSSQFSTLYYNDDKQIQKITTENGAKRDVRMSGIEEKVARTSGAKGLDTVLTQQESVGTDAPQSAETPMVHVGLLGQEDGRLDCIAQQLGRMRCDKVVKKQPKMLVVTKEELEKLKDEGRQTAKQAKASWEAMDQAEDKWLKEMGEEATNAAVKKIMHQQLFVTAPELGSNWDDALDKSVSQMEQEWQEMVEFSAPQLEALKEFKKAQFSAQKDVRLVMADAFARRDSSDYTVDTEKAVQKACQKALAESLHGNGHNTLKAQVSGLDVFRETLELEVQEIVKKSNLENARDSLEVGKEIAEQFVSDTQKQLEAIKRPVADNTKPHSDLKEMTSSIVREILGVMASQERKANNAGFIKSVNPSAEQDFNSTVDELDRLFEKELKNIESATTQMKEILKSFEGNSSKFNIEINKKIQGIKRRWNEDNKEKAVGLIADVKKYILQSLIANKSHHEFDVIKKSELTNKISNLVHCVTGWEKRASSSTHASFLVKDGKIAKFEMSYGSHAKWRKTIMNESSLINEGRKKSQTKEVKESIINPMDSEMEELIASNIKMEEKIKEYHSAEERKVMTVEVDKKIREKVLNTFNNLKKEITEKVTDKLTNNNDEIIDEATQNEKLRESMMQKPPQTA